MLLRMQHCRVEEIEYFLAERLVALASADPRGVRHEIGERRCPLPRSILMPS